MRIVNFGSWTTATGYDIKLLNDTYVCKILFLNKDVDICIDKI